MIYLDNAATTPVRNEVLEAMLPFFKQFYGNPSNVYGLSLLSRRALDGAREAVAGAIGAKLPAEIFFTSGGTEADNLAILGLARARKDLGHHIITSAIEHHAVLHACDQARSEGFEITRLPVDKFGIVDPNNLIKALRDDTILVSIMLANNEIGSLQPLSQIGEILRKHQAYLHTDAVQAVGHIKVDVQELGVDALSLSAHKFGGPKGVGAIYLRTGVRPKAIIYGGGQEHGLRSGTENVPGIVGLGKAITLANEKLEDNSKLLQEKRDYIVDKIRREIDLVHLTGHPEKRLPGNASFVFAGVEGESLLMQLDRQGVCASAGSACSASALGVSHVLEAIGLRPSIAKGSLRLSLAYDISYDDIDKAVSIIVKSVRKLQSIAPKSALHKFAQEVEGANK